MCEKHWLLGRDAKFLWVSRTDSERHEMSEDCTEGLHDALCLEDRSWGGGEEKHSEVGRGRCGDLCAEVAHGCHGRSVGLIRRGVSGEMWEVLILHHFVVSWNLAPLKKLHHRTFQRCRFLQPGL